VAGFGARQFFADQHRKHRLLAEAVKVDLATTERSVFPPVLDLRVQSCRQRVCFDLGAVQAPAVMLDPAIVDIDFFPSPVIPDPGHDMIAEVGYLVVLVGAILPIIGPAVARAAADHEFQVLLDPFQRGAEFVEEIIVEGVFREDHPVYASRFLSRALHELQAILDETGAFFALDPGLLDAERFPALLVVAQFAQGGIGVPVCDEVVSLQFERRRDQENIQGVEIFRRCDVG
jgi:hypothetical protein